MSAIFLLPGLISLYLVIRGRIVTAFLSVYLPALLLLPDGYALKLRVVASESRAELEQMFPLIAGAFQQKMDKSAATRLIGIAQSLLDR